MREDKSGSNGSFENSELKNEFDKFLLIVSYGIWEFFGIIIVIIIIKKNVMLWVYDYNYLIFARPNR